MESRLGTVRISSEVLMTIARLTALETPGVAQMAHDLPSGVDRLLRGKRANDGVHIEVIDDAVSVDLFIVAAPDTNLYEVGREIQTRVARAIKDMVGMPVLAVNVHIENIAVTPDDEQA